MRGKLILKSTEIAELLNQFKGWLMGRGLSRARRSFILSHTKKFLEEREGVISRESLEEHLQSLNISPKSKENIRSAIMQFLRFLYEIGYDVPQDIMPRIEENEEEILREFGEWLELEGLSQRTIYLYKLHARKWLEWCHLHNLDPLYATEDDARSFLLEIKHRPGRGHRYDQLRPRALASWINDLRRFYQFLSWKFRVHVNPFQGIRTPKREKTLPKALSIQEIEQIFEAARQISLEHYALVRFIYASGTRIGECANLLWKDIDFRLNQAVIRSGKGHKDRIVFFDDETARVLKALKREKRATRGDFVFNPSVKVLFRMIEQVSERAGIKFRSTDLRKSLATHMAELGIPVQDIQYVMGHEHLSTTSIYIQLRPEHVRKVYKEFWRRRRTAAR